MKKLNSLKKLAVTAVLLVLAISPLLAYATKRPPISSKKATKLYVLADMKLKNVQFGFNETTIPLGYNIELERIAKLMKDNNAAIKLGGYADNKGGYVYNWKLSQRRAEAVKAYLVSKGADETRIAATEYGYTKPIASNKTKNGRQKNRRVEMQFAE